MGCRWPSCRAPIAHCDVHHLDEHPTNHQVDNLLTLCRRHHRRLHSTFWHPRLDGHTGRFDLLRSPAGTPVHTTYPRGTNPKALTTATSGGDPTRSRLTSRTPTAVGATALPARPLDARPAPVTPALAGGVAGCERRLWGSR